MQRSLRWLRSWEGLLLILLLISIVANMMLTPYYLSVNNIVNLFMLSIEKIIVALVMTLIIINAEIDLSVASIMGLAACVLAFLVESGRAHVARHRRRVGGRRGGRRLQRLLDRTRGPAFAGCDAGRA